ncbi:MAG: AAA family ATPase [Marinagarivorans sp.]|nr:AAA family ATPase [Marinagarivorans sp.]
MAKVFAITNQKGGVGKTTTSVNLAASLAATKRRVLMIDIDPQGNATMGAGVDKNQQEYTVYDVLAGDVSLANAIVFSQESQFSVLAANSDLTAAEVQLLSVENKETRLKLAIATVADNFDYILIDCPPSLNMLTINALTACDGVIIPVQCEYYALEGLSSLIETINTVQAALNPNLKIEGIVRTMHDPRMSLTGEVSAQLSTHFSEQLYNTCIPRNVRLAEAPSFGLPILAYDKQSKGSLAYLALAGEVIKRCEPNPRKPKKAAEAL